MGSASASLLTDIKLAVVGDLHGSWVDQDHELLMKLQPDGVLFVGDLSDGDVKLIKSISKIDLPTAVILGNHDRGLDRKGDILRTQLNLLGSKHCGWSQRNWDKPPIEIVGARPCSSGGPFRLSQSVEAVYGHVSFENSVDKIVDAASKASSNKPLLILAHSGPSGLGSEPESICGRDWKLPAIDWGDKDLEIAINTIQCNRKIDIVVFGHMHHSLRRNNGVRNTFCFDKKGTAYLNSACVPRRGLDSRGNLLCHFSWIEFAKSTLQFVSHRWYLPDASIGYEEVLFDQSTNDKC